MPLATVMMSGVEAQPFIGEELAGAADAGLDLVEDQQQALVVAQLAQGAQEFRRRPARTPPSPCIGSIIMAAVCGPIAAFSAARSPSGTWSKPGMLGAEAFEIFLIARRRRCAAIGAAVKGAFEGDDVEALGMAADELVAPRHLDGEFDRLGARIGEEARCRQRCWPPACCDRLSCPGTR